MHLRYDDDAADNALNSADLLQSSRRALTPDLHGKAITYELFSHKSGYELFVAMRSFAEALLQP